MQIFLNFVENEREVTQSVTKLTTDSESGKINCLFNVPY